MKTPKIKQRSNGMYFILYIDDNSKRIRDSLKTKDELEADVEYKIIFGDYPAEISEAIKSPYMPTPVEPLEEYIGMEFINAYHHFMKSE